MSIHIPFESNKVSKSSDGKIKKAMDAQLQVWMKFNRKRNSRKIKRYFLLMKEKRNKNLFIFFCILVILGVLLGVVLLLSGKIQRTLEDIFFQIARTIFRTNSRKASALFRDSNYFSEVFSNYFFKFRKIALSKETARELVRQIVIMAYSGYHYSGLINIANEDGRCVSFEKTSNETAVLSYVESKGESSYSWNTNLNYIVDSFPFEGGIYNGPETISSSTWFSEGINKSNSTFTEMYYHDDNVQFSFVYTVINAKNKKKEIFDVDIPFDYIQEKLNDFLIGNNSIITLLSKDNQVIGYISRDTNGNLKVIKDFNNVKGTVWDCIDLNDIKNQSIKCNDKKYGTITGKFQHDISIMLIISFDDILQDHKTSYLHDLIIIYFSALGVAIAIACLTYSLKSGLIRVKTVVEVPQPNKEKSHGIPLAISECKKVINIHSDNSEITKSMNSVISLLNNSCGTLHFQNVKFITSINDDKVRNKMIKKFQVDDFIKNEKELTTSTNSNTFNEKINKSNKLLENAENIYNLKSLFYKATNKQIDYLINHISNKNKLFSSDKYSILISKALNHIQEKNIPLLINSITFFDLLCMYRIDAVIDNSDLISIVHIMILSFHIAINKKRSSKSSFIEKLFLLDIKKIMKISKQILEKMKPYRNDKNEQRWNEYITYIYKFIEITPIFNHQQIISQTLFYLTESKQNQQLNTFESLLLTKFAYLASTISFYFANRDIRIESLGLIDLNIDELPSQTFHKCLNQTIIMPEYKALSQYFGTDFLSKVSI